MRAVGYRQGREERVRALPIPQKLQDELLYKHVSILYELEDSDSDMSSDYDHNSDWSSKESDSDYDYDSDTDMD